MLDNLREGGSKPLNHQKENNDTYRCKSCNQKINTKEKNYCYLCNERINQLSRIHPVVTDWTSYLHYNKN